MQEQRAGRWFRSDTRYGPLFHARLFAGQENLGRLMMMVKQQAHLWHLRPMRRCFWWMARPGSATR
jgi:MinD superfamily P-loop ATPase